MPVEPVTGFTVLRERNDVVRCFGIRHEGAPVLRVRNIDDPPLAVPQTGRHLLELNRHLDGIAEARFIEVYGVVDGADDGGRVGVTGDRAVEGWVDDKARLCERSEHQSAS